MKQLYYGDGKMHCQSPVVPLSLQALDMQNEKTDFMGTTINYLWGQKKEFHFFYFMRFCTTPSDDYDLGDGATN